MKKIAVAVAGALFVTLMPGAAFAQTFTIPDRIEKLSARARESTNITLDGALLQLASQFLSGKDGDEKAVKELVSKLKSIHVRNFEFDKDGEYADSDLDLSDLRAHVSILPQGITAYPRHPCGSTTR